MVEMNITDIVFFRKACTRRDDITMLMILNHKINCNKFSILRTKHLILLKIF